MAAAGARLIDTDFALETASLTKNAILNQAALAMAAQAKLSSIVYIVSFTVKTTTYSIKLRRRFFLAFSFFFWHLNCRNSFGKLYE